MIPVAVVCNNTHFCSHFALVKHVKSSISDKYDAEFMFGFDELANPLTMELTSEGAVINMTLEESSGLVCMIM